MDCFNLRLAGGADKRGVQVQNCAIITGNRRRRCLMQCKATDGGSRLAAVLWEGPERMGHKFAGPTGRRGAGQGWSSQGGRLQLVPVRWLRKWA